MTVNVAERHPRQTYPEEAQRVYLSNAGSFAVQMHVSLENGDAQKLSEGINTAIKTAVSTGELPRKFAKHCNAVEPEYLGVTVLDRSVVEENLQLSKLRGDERSEKIDLIEQLACSLHQLLAQYGEEFSFEPGDITTFGNGNVKPFLGVIQKGWKRYYSHYPSVTYLARKDTWERPTTSVIKDMKATCVEALCQHVVDAEEFKTAAFLSKPHIVLVKNPRGFRPHEVEKLVPVLQRVIPEKITLTTGVVVPGNRHLREILKEGIPLQQPSPAVERKITIATEIDEYRSDIEAIVRRNRARRQLAENEGIA